MEEGVSKVARFIERISLLQSNGVDSPIPDGMFPVRRVNGLIGYRREDSCIFFPALISFTLQNLRIADLPPGTLKQVENITERIAANYARYRNKDGLSTYNFWPTVPNGHFTPGLVFHRFEHFKIPDDIDDTAMVYLTLPADPKKDLWLKDKLSQHSNGSSGWIKNTFSEYQQLRAYSTWFGKRMYMEFDVCALSNLMYWVFERNLPRDRHDHDSLVYIESVISSGRFLTNPFSCAHHYPRAPLIIYHLARLIGRFDPPELAHLRPILTKTAINLLARSELKMDRIILSTSILRLGGRIQPVDTSVIDEKDFADFPFFIAGLMTAFENSFTYRLAKLPLFHMSWHCSAYCLGLLAEYEAEFMLSLR